MLSKRALQTKASATSAVLEKVNQLRTSGATVISFGAGELDFHTPDEVKEAAKWAIDNNMTRYTNVTGHPALKAAIVSKLQKEHNVRYEPDQVVVSNGGKHALYNVIQTIIDPGDEVLIPVPYWVSYTEMIQSAGGKSVFVPTRLEDGFVLKAEEIEKWITIHTKALIINNPNNPTGAVIAPEELEKIGQLACKYGFLLIADEVYAGLLYDQTTVSLASISEEIKERTIIINSMSKAYAMTGWRIGYLAAPKEIARYAGIIQGHNASNANSIAQMASVAGLSAPHSFVNEIIEELQARRDYMYDALLHIPGFQVPPKPDGAFYLFVNIEGFGMSSLDFCSYLVEQANVAVIPGEAFGMEGFVRFSYACSMQEIEEGMQKISRTAAALRESIQSASGV